MALAAWKVLVDDGLAKEVRDAFEADEEIRQTATLL